MDKVIPVKFDAIKYCWSVKHGRGMDGQTDDGWNDPYFSDTQ